MTRPKDGQEKFESIAYRMYLADFELHFEASEIPLEWEQMDAEEKFAWMYVATAALKEIAVLEDFQRATVVENYRNRTPYPILAGETWETVTAGFFEWGYNHVFLEYAMPSGDAAGLNL